MNHRDPGWYGPHPHQYPQAEPPPSDRAPGPRRIGALAWLHIALAVVLVAMVVIAAVFA